MSELWAIISSDGVAVRVSQSATIAQDHPDDAEGCIVCAVPRAPKSGEIAVVANGAFTEWTSSPNRARATKDAWIISRFADAQQTFIYARKENEARAFIALGLGALPALAGPMLTAEAAATNVLVRDLALAVIARADSDREAYLTALNRSEAARRAAKVA